MIFYVIQMRRRRRLQFSAAIDGVIFILREDGKTPLRIAFYCRRPATTPAAAHSAPAGARFRIQPYIHSLAIISRKNTRRLDIKNPPTRVTTWKTRLDSPNRYKERSAKRRTRVLRELDPSMDWIGLDWVWKMDPCLTLLRTNV